MEPSFEKLLVHLLNDSVDFIVVGGLAVTLNGYIRLTEDVDILVSLEPDNIERLIDSLGNLGEGHGRTLVPEDFTPEPGAIRIVEETEQIQVDIFSTMDGLFYQDLIENAEISAAAEKEFFYASKTQLIRFKSSSVREKDQIDALALRKLLDDPNAFD